MLTTAALALLGCTGATYGYPGSKVYDHFPLDGQRAWDYSQDGTKWILHVEKTQTTDVAEMEIVTLSYSEKDGALLYEIDWSSDQVNGVLIHGYTMNGQEPVQYQPAVVFGEFQMQAGETVEGGGFSSTFVGVETCPNHWVEDESSAWDCLRMEVTGGSGAEPFLGTWWIAPRYGASRFHPAPDANPWVLLSADWESGGQ